MSAALTTLCQGDRRVRDKARMYIDRVKIWETQGNARSTQDISVSVPAVCVWLAAESLGVDSIQRRDLQRSSGLAPARFDRAENLLRQVIATFDRTRHERVRTIPAARPERPNTRRRSSSQGELIQRAKQIQESAQLGHGAVEAIPPPSSSEAFDAAMKQPPQTKVPKRIREESPNTPLSATDSAPDRPKADPSHIRLLALGVPSYREGLQFEVQHRRKRGRPPAKRLSLQEMNDKQFLDSLWSNSPLPSHLRIAGMPLRYVQKAHLDAHDSHWIRPLPRPLSIYSGNPSGTRLRPSHIWNKWVSQSLCP